ncbi:MAG: hypothetical protein AAFR61_15655 [Bacteroidota bacterium]
MKLRTIIAPLLLTVLLLGPSCGSIDLSLINEVKRFEPEWMNLSETVTYLKRNLNLTERRYPEDYSDAKPFLSDASANRRSSLYGLSSKYQNLMSERDQMHADFRIQLVEFDKQVAAFNEWVNKLMKNKLGQEEASSAFVEYKRSFRELKKAMEDLQTALILNIESHNDVMRQIAAAIPLYNNYDINPV